MNDITRILSDLESGDPAVAEQLLTLVYGELRRIAAARLAKEKPGHTLQATALVHEAYLRLLGTEGQTQQWNGRRHFYAAAAEAMRRILIDHARRQLRLKRGQRASRHVLDQVEPFRQDDPGELLAIHEAIDKLAEEDPQAAELVKLRYFAGVSVAEAAELAGLSRSTAYEHWSYARAWLRCYVHGDQEG
jgi:RNA polymerase sigma factor (TIGR02999 family)